MVVTIEPGIYVPFDNAFPSAFHGLGIRIEASRRRSYGRRALTSRTKSLSQETARSYSVPTLQRRLSMSKAHVRAYWSNRLHWRLSNSSTYTSNQASPHTTAYALCNATFSNHSITLPNYNIIPSKGRADPDHDACRTLPCWALCHLSASCC